MFFRSHLFYSIYLFILILFDVFTDGCLILKIKEVLQNKCGILSDPMGKQDSVQMSQEVPVVHPIIKLSKDHFRKNTAFTDGRYRVLEEERKAYKYAEEVQFDDVVGLVVSLVILFYF